MTDETSSSELLRVEDLAKLFNKSTVTVVRWTRQRRLPKPLRPGGPNSTPYWQKQVIEEFIAAGSIEAFRRNRRSK